MKIEHIIWDWNGTLYNDAQACVNTLNVILQTRSLPLVDLHQYREVFRFPVIEYYKILGFDFTDEEWDAMAIEFHDIYFEESKTMNLRDGVVETMDRFKENGVPMSVLSASEEGVLLRLLSKYGIRDYFEKVQGLTDIYAHSKLEAGRKLLGELPHEPSEVLLVGDTMHDYEVANELGCKCALMSEGHQARHRLETCGCDVYGSLEDIVLTD